METRRESRYDRAQEEKGPCGMKLSIGGVGGEVKVNDDPKINE
jgi:hypothetical protein